MEKFDIGQWPRPADLRASATASNLRRAIFPEASDSSLPFGAAARVLS